MTGDRVARWVIPVYMVLCLVFGGASAAGLWANVILQLLAIAILCWVFATEGGPAIGHATRQLVVLTMLVASIPLVQLVPLPPAIWSELPGREAVVETFRLVGRPLPWLPMTLTPYQTFASLLWTLPALAVLSALLRQGAQDGGRIAWAIVSVMAASVLIGALQISGGEASPWYFYRITNYGVTVGFFSNANHMATLLAVSLPFLAALYLSGRNRARNDSGSGAQLAITGAMLLLVVVGLFINGSLAGLGLMLPVAAASGLMTMRRKPPVWAIGLITLLAAASVATVFSGRFDNNLIAPDVGSSVVSRYTTFTNSYEAAKDYFPVGSGLGSFQDVYRLYEDPDQVTTTYINHVHSDWIEWILETGLFGLLMLMLFLVWWGRRTLGIWQSSEPDHVARAATIASAAIMAHSLVDYPLRTAAISAIFAACCALMADTRPALRQSGDRRPPMRPTRHVTAQ